MRKTRGMNGTDDDDDGSLFQLSFLKGKGLGRVLAWTQRARRDFFARRRRNNLCCRFCALRTRVSYLETLRYIAVSLFIWNAP